MNLKTFDDKYSFFDFHFRTDEVQVKSYDNGITNISTDRQSLNFSDVGFLMFEDEIENVPIMSEMFSPKAEVEKAYGQGKAAILFYSPAGSPVHLFFGEKIRLTDKTGGVSTFLIDNRTIQSKDMGYFVVSHKAS